MGITENAAYLKGLAEGLNINESTNEGKLILKMLDVIEEMAEKIEVLESANEELYAYVEEMAEDLVNLEDELYEDESDDDYSDLNEDYEETEYVDEEYYEVECPTCGEKICFTDEFDLDNFVCPACGNKIDDIELIDGCDGCEGCTADCEGRESCDGCHNV